MTTIIFILLYLFVIFVKEFNEMKSKTHFEKAHWRTVLITLEKFVWKGSINTVRRHGKGKLFMNLEKKSVYLNYLLFHFDKNF